MISVLALLLVLGQLYWPSASPQANTATHGQRWMLDEKKLKYHLNQIEVWNGVN
jgi:hypothetical protein